MSDLPIALAAPFDEQLAGILDVEAKIPRALESLGPVKDRDVLLLDGAEGIRSRQLSELGARVAFAPGNGAAAANASADVLVSLWTSFRDGFTADLAEAKRIVRPGGRLLVVLDYGRDDVSRLRGDIPEYGLWSRRDGQFLRGGFKVRVVHCFWTFDSMDDAWDFLGPAFGTIGREVAGTMKRPRLSYNVAVYHRTLGVAG